MWLSPSITFIFYACTYWRFTTTQILIHSPIHPPLSTPTYCDWSLWLCTCWSWMLLPFSTYPLLSRSRYGNTERLEYNNQSEFGEMATIFACSFIFPLALEFQRWDVPLFISTAVFFWIIPAFSLYASLLSLLSISLFISLKRWERQCRNLQLRNVQLLCTKRLSSLWSPRRFPTPLRKCLIAVLLFSLALRLRICFRIFLGGQEYADGRNVIWHAVGATDWGKGEGGIEGRKMPRKKKNAVKDHDLSCWWEWNSTFKFSWLPQAHVCVLQTCLELRRRGYEVLVVADASSSRSQVDRMFAFEVCMHMCARSFVSKSTVKREVLSARRLNLHEM